MNKYGFTTLIFTLIISSTFAQGFKFAALSDSRGDFNGVNDPVVTALITHMMVTNPDIKFLVVTGDLVNGHDDDPARTKRELLHWKEVMAPLYNNPNMVWPKIWPVIGNHEVRNPKDIDNFKEVFPDVFMNGPAGQKGVSYSFDFENSHFCMINSDHWYYGDPNDSTDDRRDWHYIKDLDWVEEDFKAARGRGVEHIFTFSHEMPFPIGGHLRDGLPNLGKNLTLPMDSTRLWYLEQRNKYWALMKKYNADAHICGHEHTYGREEVEGVYQVLTGSSGAPLYNFNPTPETDADTTIRFELPYEKATTYYKVLDYNYGPGKNSQRSENFVGYKAFNYTVFDVRKDSVIVKMYGSFPKEGSRSEMGTKIKLLDEFVMKKK
ncbi:MAG: hypothetical protein GXO85_17405 [Chlorobi bacterium]|nr:hypothetical protein [Chlorobiota bacterium]